MTLERAIVLELQKEENKHLFVRATSDRVDEFIKKLPNELKSHCSYAYTIHLIKNIKAGKYPTLEQNKEAQKLEAVTNEDIQKYISILKSKEQINENGIIKTDNFYILKKIEEQLEAYENIRSDYNIMLDMQ